MTVVIGWYATPHRPKPEVGIVSTNYLGGAMGNGKRSDEQLLEAYAGMQQWHWWNKR